MRSRPRTMVWSMMNQLGMEPIDCPPLGDHGGRGGHRPARHCSRAPGSFGDVIGVPDNAIYDLNLLAKPDNVKLVVKGGALVKKLD